MNVPICSIMFQYIAKCLVKVDSCSKHKPICPMSILAITQQANGLPEVQERKCHGQITYHCTGNTT